MVSCGMWNHLLCLGNNRRVFSRLTLWQNRNIMNDHQRKSTGVTINVNDRSIPLSFPLKWDSPALCPASASEHLSAAHSFPMLFQSETLASWKWSCSVPPVLLNIHICEHYVWGKSPTNATTGGGWSGGGSSGSRFSALPELPLCFINHSHAFHIKVSHVTILREKISCYWGLF